MNPLVGPVETRPNQVIHGRIHDDEILLLPFLQIQDPGDQDPGIPDQDPARLQEEATSAIAKLKSAGVTSVVFSGDAGDCGGGEDADAAGAGAGVLTYSEAR